MSIPRRFSVSKGMSAMEKVKQYDAPHLEVIKLAERDVICESDGFTGDYPYQPTGLGL